MADDVKVLRAGAEMKPDYVTEHNWVSSIKMLVEVTAVLSARMADMIEREERELTFTHEQINERDQVIADEAWNAAIEACRKTVSFHPQTAYRHEQGELMKKLQFAIAALRREQRP